MSLVCILFVPGNSGDIDDTEYYVEHVVFAILRDSDQLLYYRSTPNHDVVCMQCCSFLNYICYVRNLQKFVVVYSHTYESRMPATSRSVKFSLGFMVLPSSDTLSSL